VTVADEPQAQAGVPVRAWRAFSRWRRSRPFWGGLITLLAGLEYYFSVHLKPTNLTVSFGQQGFLAWLIPLILVACALLAWFTPAQRIFYGIVTAAAAVYGLIGLNLGGFFIGLLLGMVGGALIASWAPLQPATGAGAADEIEPTDPDGAAADTDELAETDHPGSNDDRDPREHDLDSAQTEIIPVYRESADERRSGPLSDELPASPLAGDGERGGRHALAEQDKPAGLGRLWKPRGRNTALILIPLTVAAVGLIGLQRSAPAYAAPAVCPGASATKKAPTTNGKAQTTPAHTPSVTASVTPSATPSASETQSSGLLGGLINGIVDGVKSLVGADDPAASASASPSTTPSSAAPSSAKAAPSTPSTSKGTGGTSCPRPTASKSAAPANAKILAADPGQVAVAGAPALLTTAKLDMSKLSYDGVVNLPRKDGTGTVQVLKFSMGSAVQTPFQLDVPAHNGTLNVVTATQLTISGNVEFYCTSFVGWLLNVIKLTFTPGSPPPLVLPEMTFYRAEIQLVFVHADKLVAGDFRSIGN
jgi:hypothetical protein